MKGLVKCSASLILDTPKGRGDFRQETDLHRAECDRHLSMQVIAFTSLDELAPYADDWDRLAAGSP